jgi:hypothetical protein
MSVTDTDMGYADLVKALGDLAGPVVLVGVREEAGAVRGGGKVTETTRTGRNQYGTWSKTTRTQEGGDGATVAEYATYNEFGMGVPERSFLRSTVDVNEKRYVQQLADACGKVIDGSASVQSALGVVGLGAARDVQQTIRDLADPPNAPSTVRQKGSSSPLIDTGRLRASIDHEVRESGVDDLQPGVGS